jgi:hypothetical protein
MQDRQEVDAAFPFLELEPSLMVGSTVVDGKRKTAGEIWVNVNFWMASERGTARGARRRRTSHFTAGKANGVPRGFCGIPQG